MHERRGEIDLPADGGSDCCGTTEVMPCYKTRAPGYSISHTALTAQTHQHFRGSHHLADMALSVIGHVNQRATNAGRELLAT